MANLRNNRSKIQTGEFEGHVGHLDFKENGLVAQGLFSHPKLFGDEKLEVRIYRNRYKPQNQINT